MDVILLYILDDLACNAVGLDVNHDPRVVKQPLAVVQSMLFHVPSNCDIEPVGYDAELAPAIFVFQTQLGVAAVE